MKLGGGSAACCKPAPFRSPRSGTGTVAGGLAVAVDLPVTSSSAGRTAALPAPLVRAAAGGADHGHGARSALSSSEKNFGGLLDAWLGDLLGVNDRQEGH
jgi:hypothetical protein